MKKDKLERFIRDNREGFDSYEPSAELWSRLEARLPAAETLLPEKTAKKAAVKPLYSHRAAWLTAASLMLLLGLAGTYFLKIKPAPAADPAIARVDPSQARTAFQYASLIEQRQAALQQFNAEHPEIGLDFAEQMQGLDAEYQRLRQELARTPNQQEVLTAMMQNLQWQLNLLTRQTRVMQQVKTARHEKPFEL